MKAAVKVGKEKFEIQDVSVPSIKEDECLIKIKNCAVCVWCYEEWMRDGTNNPKGPGVTGHEVSGVVEKAGSKVTNWKQGDEVLVYNGWFCGTCPECLEGKETYCSKRHVIVGGYAEYAAVPERNLLVPPNGIGLKYAGLITDMVGTPMHAIRRSFSVNIDRSIVTVWGLGPVGMFAVQGLKTFEGVKKVIAIDPVQNRRELALTLGADEVLDPLDPNTAKKLLEENNGRGVNYAFNCALRNPDAIDMAFRTIKIDGYLMNITGRALSGSQREIRVDGSYYFFKNEYDKNVDLVMAGKIKLEPVLTHDFILDDINDAMELRSKHPDKALKVNIICSE